MIHLIDFLKIHKGQPLIIINTFTKIRMYKLFLNSIWDSYEKPRVNIKNNGEII